MTDFTGAAGKAGRAMQLTKRRQKMQEEMLLRKRKIEDELKIGRIDKKFASHYDAIEQELRTSTIGLVTLDQMKTKQENIMKERERQISLLKLEEDRRQKDKAQKKLNYSLKQASALSFNFEEEDLDDKSESDTNESKDALINSHKFIDENKNRKKYGKDPTIDTSFLPDKDREEEENKLRDQLRLEWVQKQEQIKSEEIEIVYSYWDGSGHRRTAKMTKGSSIQQFLLLCLDTLRKEEVFHELKTVTVDSMMFVKEDLIIPHTYTFYDFIVTKARGKSGPLFNFDAYDDIRLRSDASIDKDESHAGKVVLRTWYDKNKHIFPASRWEPYDPNKKWDAYTIADKDPRRF